MEQIYTIPINEAFDLCREKPECGCPLCVLYKRLQEHELDLILGASMMEPSIRMQTNEEGFCLTHYNMMLGRRRMLGIGLMLESHLDEVMKKLDGPILIGDKRKAALNALGKLEGDCYVCRRVENNFASVIANVCYLHETDYDFRKKFDEQPWFCMPHYRAMLDYASKKMNKRNYGELYSAAYKIQSEYIKALRGDVSWFCKKFDYRYNDEPWYNSKDAIQRTVRFLDGCFGEEEKPNISGQ